MKSSPKIFLHGASKTLAWSSAKWTLRALLLGSSVYFQLPAAAYAEPAEPAASPSAAVAPAPEQKVAAARGELRHAPVSVTEGGSDFLVVVDVLNPHLVKAMFVHYRRQGAASFARIPLKLSGTARYSAVVPAASVAAPAIEYYFSLTQLDGRLSHVGSTDYPFVTQVIPDALGSRESYLTERLSHHRSVFHGGADYVHFGSTQVATQPGSSEIVRDAYYRIEGAYTYRPLQTITEFSLRLGMVRGSSPAGAASATNTGASGKHVGLNYGAPSVLVYFLDGWHGEFELLTSITEVGFALGGSGATLLGDPYGTHLKLGFETVQVFGTRFYSQLALPYSSWLTLVPMIEVTDMPHADRYGARLVLDAHVKLSSSLSMNARAGYQARVFDSGGPSAGVGMAYAY